MEDKIQHILQDLADFPTSTQPKLLARLQAYMTSGDGLFRAALSRAGDQSDLLLTALCHVTNFGYFEYNQQLLSFWGFAMPLGITARTPTFYREDDTVFDATRLTAVFQSQLVRYCPGGLIGLDPRAYHVHSVGRAYFGRLHRYLYNLARHTYQPKFPRPRLPDSGLGLQLAVPPPASMYLALRYVLGVVVSSDCCDVQAGELGNKALVAHELESQWQQRDPSTRVRAFSLHGAGVTRVIGAKLQQNLQRVAKLDLSQN